MAQDITPFVPQALVPVGIESAASGIAAQSKAAVEARYTIALHRPRKWDVVRQTLLKECQRPSFANNKSAYYRKPIGQGVEGLGIRFVEVALRCMTNVLIETTMVFEDESKEVHRVSVTDLESNLTYPMDVKVSKAVERSKPADDGSFISVRKNSYGKNVYTVIGSDDDLLNKRGALISKAIRTLGLRIIPGDLQDEAEEIIKKVRLDEAARDPGAEAKRMVDAFDAIGVSAAMLTEHLGHPIANCTPKELVDLRGLYGAIKDGEATWQSVMDNKSEAKSEAKSGNGQDAPPEKPVMTAEAFAKRAPAYREQIENGLQSPNELIATIETKAALTSDQKMEIASWANSSKGE